MNEFDLIKRLTAGLAKTSSVVVGPGDDCAVLDFGLPGEWLLLKTDAVVEGVHFEPGEDMEKVGHKALARCLSDVAAMSGLPASALITLGMPDGAEPDQLDALYRGLERTARRYNVAIVGGETTRSPGGLLVSVAVLGRVEKGRCILRSGAKAGDAIFVSGELGGSLAGKHLEFEPRLAESRWLTERFQVNAMIDLSDGLAGDIRHVLEASGVGAELLADAIPISRAAKLKGHGKRVTADPVHPEPRGAAAGASALMSALRDGEDFELLFTVPAGSAVAVLDAWRAQYPHLRLSCVGKIVSEPGVRIRDRRGARPLEVHGYTHFQNS